MRKRYALLGLVPFGILAACEDDGAGGSIDLNLDGGQVVIDGAVPPTPTADAGDAGPLPVSIVVTRDGAPEANVPVVFQDATGVVIASVTTSATGIATQLVPTGSQVTVVMGTALAPRLLTITEVEPGDTLAAVDVTTPEARDVSVTNVPSGAPASSNIYASAGRCNSNVNELPFAIYLAPRCQLAGTFPVLLTAYDVETNAETGFTFKKTNPFGAPDGGDPISAQVTEPWSTAVHKHTIAVTNVPSGARVDTAFSEVTSGVARPLNDSVYNEGADAATFQTQHFAHPGYPDFIQSEIERSTTDTQARVTAIATREAPPAGAATTTFDFTALLPFVDEATIDQTTRDRPSVTWKTEAGKSLDTADGAYVLINWIVTESDTTQHFGEWTFVTPANRTTVKAPQLPTNLTQFAPPTGEVELYFPEPAIVTVIEGAAIAGYGDFRKVSASVPASVALQWSNGSDFLIPPMPVAGTLRATAFTRNND